MDSNIQTSRMLKMLRQNPNGVENYKFPQAGILKYSSRITDLRHDGYTIVAERQVINGRSTGVWKYYLVHDETEGRKPSLLERFIHKTA